MQYVYIICGIPGSGKTTLSKQLAEEYSMKRFSFDEMNCYTTRQFVSTAIVALQEGKSIIMDSTLLKKASRRIILQAISNFPCRKVCIFMNTPLDECLQRNAQREIVIPDVIIRSIHETMQVPTLEEGWDEVIIK